MPQPLPPKKEVALALLERSRVHVHLDPRKDGVAVPVGFRKQPQLVLEIGLNMPVPIPDLRLDDEGMTCTLSFSRTPFFCAVPWTSVFAMVGDDGRGMVWPEDVPAEIQAQAARPVESQPHLSTKPRAVPSLKSAPAEGTAGDKGKPEKPEKSDEKREDGEKKPKRAAKGKKPRPMAAVESEPDRPVLVALPQPPTPRGPRAVPNPKKRAPAPARKPAAGHGKAKRELPPYLRVVK
jgi:stringent starvation protein B